MNYGPIVQAILFALFGALTAAVAVVTAPTYDNLFVPEMSPASAFASWTGGNVFAAAVDLSNTLLTELVDPLAVLVIAAVGFLYMVRSVYPSPKLTGLAPKLLFALLVANLVIPLTSVVWQLAGGVYPVFYEYGGGAWRSYSNLVGPGAVDLSWDNGVLGLVVSWILFGLVLLLAFLIAFRGALVAVLLVVLPPLTLLYPLPGARAIARRAWILFVEMAFLPCFVVIPLVLAVGSGSVLVTLGLFAVALAMPQILSSSGTAISHAGFPNTSFTVAGGLTQGAGTAQETATGWLRRGGRSFSQGLDSASPTSGVATGPSTAARGVASKGGRASPSSSGGLGGPAGLVAWGLQEGIGGLARTLGQRAAGAGQALGQGRSPTSPLGSGEGRSRLPPRVPGAHRIRSRGPAPTLSAA